MIRDTVKNRKDPAGLSNPSKGVETKRVIKGMTNNRDTV